MELLQTTTAQFIPKCDGIVTNCEGLVYYKVRWNYYKLRQLFNYKSRHGLLQSAMIITDCLSTVYSDTLQLKEEVDYISTYPEIDKGYFSHARQLTPRKCCLCRSQVYFQKRVTRASTFSETNYVRRRRALNEEFASFSCELPYYILFPCGLVQT